MFITSFFKIIYSIKYVPEKIVLKLGAKLHENSNLGVFFWKGQISIPGISIMICFENLWSRMGTTLVYKWSQSDLSKHSGHLLEWIKLSTSWFVGIWSLILLTGVQLQKYKVCWWVCTTCWSVLYYLPSEIINVHCVKK